MTQAAEQRAEQRAAELYAEALALMGLDLTAPDLRDTPARSLRALRELAGQYPDPAEPLRRTFSMEWTYPPSPVVSARVPFTSLCEHHLMPFTGTVDMAYTPSATHRPEAGTWRGQVVGLSKLARAARALAARPQMQERYTAELADLIFMTLRAQGVTVAVRGTHTCQTLRGACAGGVMVTEEQRGTHATAKGAATVARLFAHARQGA